MLKIAVFTIVNKSLTAFTISVKALQSVIRMNFVFIYGNA